jgi:hypothetical protein
VPAELETFIAANVADPPQHATVEEFSKGLAFFERPGRKSDVERLVGRAIAAEAQTRAEEELRRLKEKALEASERGRSKSEETGEPHKPGRSRVPMAVAALVILLVAASVGVWSWRSQGQAPEETATDTAPTATPAPEGQAAATGADATAVQPAAEGAAPAKAAEGEGSLVARVSDAVRSAIDKIAGPSGDVQPKAAAEPAPPPSPPARTARSRRSAPALTPVAKAAPLPATAPKIEVTEIPTSPSSFDAATDEGTFVDDTVYSSADATVQPPVMVRPVLPAEPPHDVDADDVGTLELLINEYGDVDQVKLVSPANRFRERMIVASAKAWKFQPAMKDGQPVKYRTRVRLTI